jgi:hypothetical protein
LLDDKKDPDPDPGGPIPYGTGFGSTVLVVGMNYFGEWIIF